MGFSLKGYVLEKPRVSSANSPFTPSPDNLVSDSGAYTATYGTNELVPGRGEYLVVVLVDGDLANAEFGWTKNEGGLQRFDFDGSEQRFRPMRGAARLEVGTVTSSANATRLKVPKPTVSVGVGPYRLALGTVGSGLTVPIVTVPDDGSFGAPAAGTVELSLSTGNLNWNASDLTGPFQGQRAFFQRQAFFSAKESTGRLGVATDTILLNPIPATGQFPQLRFGFGLPLHPVEKANEASFSANPTQGTFEWALDTGRVKFNSSDISSNPGEAIYYDGVLLGIQKRLPRQTVGTIGAPTPVVGLPSEGGDLIFRALPPTLPSGTASFPSTTTVVDGAANFTLNAAVGDIVVLTSGPNVGSRRAITAVTSATQLQVAPPFPSVVGANYTIQRKIVQFPEFVRTTTPSLIGKSGQVQVNPSSGALQFSFAEILAYGAYQAEVIFGDLPVERGISLRLFRTPVDLGAKDPSTKDVSAFYPTVNARLADPIVGAPLVFLPVVPVDDPAYPMSFVVEQGTGSFTGALPRLDVAFPPGGIGYTIDYDTKRFNFAIRRNNYVLPIQTRVGAVQLKDPLVNPANVTLELDQGLGYVPLTLGTDSLLEPTSGVVTFVETIGSRVVQGAGGQILSLSTFNDPNANFAGVLVGDQLVISNSSEKGVYTVTGIPSSVQLTFSPAATLNTSGLSYEIRRGKEILVDRFFQELVLVDPGTKVEKIRALGTITNSPRLNIPAANASISRFRLGLAFLTTTTVVPNDGAFTSPALLPAGTVEVSQATGNLNFSQSNVATGSTVYWARLLVQGKEYRIEPELGFIQVTERLLAMDELFLTYSSLQNPAVQIEERATFLVRKELTTHPTATSTIPFNPLGREVATNPSPVVFRGGRPQDSTQVSVSSTPSLITFLADKLPTPGGSPRVSDTLPHGAIVQPSERVYVDYFVYNAIGGENTTTVLQPPINLAKVTLSEGASTFKVKGNRTANFPADHLLRVDGDQVYMLAGATYNAGTNETTVTLAAPQVFRDSFSQPKLYVTSGPVRVTAAFLQPSYFALEMASYDTTPRGMNKFKIQGDKTASYSAGTVINWSSASPLVNDFLLVTGSTYDVSLDRTEVTTTQATARQYTPGVHVLRRSVRSVLEATAQSVRTSTPPAIPPPALTVLDSVVVFRRVEGQAGQVLSSPQDFSIDEAGKVSFTTPLRPNEEFSIFYTRHRFVQPGQLRASYTASISPDATNGLVNQTLTANFTTVSPDAFFYRVETLTNFRGEVASKYKEEAKSSVPSGGPRTDNASQPKLYQQGQKSVFFDEGYYSNEDLVARASLKFYNDIVNFLEDLLQNMDGRIVGDYDGRFKFNGTTGTLVSNFDLANNQIDDTFKISPFPIDFTPPLLPFKFLGTYVKAYEPNARSRFFPTARTRYNYTTVGADTSAETGNQMVDLTAKNLTGIAPVASRRSPRARVTKAAEAGATSLTVDATGAITTLPGPFRPAFVNGMKVVVRDPSGAYLVSELLPATATVSGPTTLNLAPAVPVTIPVGSTVHLAALDTAYQKNYRTSFDIGLDPEKGFLLFVKPYPPFDGTFPLIPPELEIQDPNSGELLQTSFTIANSRVEPEKFPGLFGGAFDDDGDQRLPLLNPTYVRETAPTTEPGAKPCYLSTEISAGTDVAANAVDPFIGLGSGTLDPTRTVITNGVNFPAPAPQVGDLVRILTGLNGVTEFRRIIAATVNTITVDVAFASQDAGFNYLVTTAANLATGSLSLMVGATITDLLANFTVAGVKPGHTVVLTQVPHGAYLERRQVASVSATQITLTAPFSNLAVPASYRVHNPINTYSFSDLTPSVSGQLAILQTNPNSELNSIDNVYNSALTDRLSPAIGSGNATAADTLVGIGVNFVTSGVAPGDILYVQPGQPNKGFYTISEVVNSTTVKISDSPGFVSFPVGMTFRIGKLFGVRIQTLRDLFDVRENTLAYVQALQTWGPLVSTPVDVLVPPGVVDATYFARAYTSADFAARNGTVSGRKTYLDTIGISTVEKILSSGDRLYDVRYTWIDARINLEKGILVRQSRAVTERLKAQDTMLKQLIKLLAVES